MVCGAQVSGVHWVGEKSLKRLEEMLDLKLTIRRGVIQGQAPDARHYCQVGPHAERLALGLGNVGRTTPPENLRAAIEATHSC